MPEPMSDERLAEIGEMLADYQQRHSHRGAFACCSAHPVADTVPALLAEVERLRAERGRVLVAMTYFQGPEECLERECEEYFDDGGDERPGVEYCSHLKPKRLSVDEHLAALAERDRLANLVRDLTDPDPCDFDHKGGCQAHGYLSLQPGEKCPHAEAKELLALDDPEATP